MTTPITITTSNNQMHNDIMAAGLRERPPMLATIPATSKQQRQLCIVEQETYNNTTQVKRRLINAEAEVIHMILNGIGDDIYSIVDVCSTAREIWLAIERLQQRESINKQDVKIKLFWEFGKFTSREGESIESYYSRFYKMMNEMVWNKLKVDTMQQHQNEVNKICAEKIARNANPLALVVAAQPYTEAYYQTSKPHKIHAPSPRQIQSSRSHALNRTKSKEIAKPVTPLYKSAFEEDSDPEQAQRNKDMLINLALIAKNDRQSRQFGNQRTMIVVGSRETISNQAKDYAYHKEKMMLCKQEEKGVPLSVEQGDWLADTDDEPYEQDLEAHYMYMAKI
ncbi:hypothetical protein Tco_0875897 [Tanacetum coccineum]|uniref:Gag-Pol polyprotein n=1 Tax=Tanacetum coccineum TaxID=301880 RepID=A0ABQ5BTL2_9ASTR